MKKIFFFLLLFLFFGTFSINAHADSYKKSLKKWTRGDKVFIQNNLQASIIWHATLLNNPMLGAQALKYAKLYDADSLQKREFVNNLEAKKGGGVLFFISFFAPVRHYNDLTNLKGNWKLRLEAGGKKFEPVKIEKVSNPQALDRVFYPYCDVWSKGYYVWFPAEAGFSSFPWTFSVYGPTSHSHLVWK